MGEIPCPFYPEKECMLSFGHEKLYVYQLAIEFVGCVYHFCEDLKGYRNAKDLIIRATESIPFNIAEGNEKVLISSANILTDYHLQWFPVFWEVQILALSFY